MKNQVNSTVFAIGVIGICSTALATAQSSWNNFRPADYSVTIKKAKRIKDAKVKITFRAMPETLFFCPGANGKTTKDGLILTFVRSSIKRKLQVQYRAKVISDTATRFIVVDAKDQPIYMKSGKKLVKIYPPTKKK